MEQLFCLIAFTATGIVIGVLFDIFRILRRSFKTADWLTTLQDILFWILAGFVILFSIFKFNNGEIRSYIFIGIALGVLIYMLTLSKYIVKYSVIIIKFIKDYVKEGLFRVSFEVKNDEIVPGLVRELGKLGYKVTITDGIRNILSISWR